MKTKITLTSMVIASFFAINSLNAQTDLSIGNISAGWDTYSQSTGVITGVYFDVLNNDNSNPGAFDVKVYLVDPNNSSNSWAVWTYTDSDGQNGNTVVTYSNIDIDFNNTSGIPAGQYRLAVCVDPDNYISETDENNNCLYLSTMGNNLTYSPGSAGVNDISQLGGVIVYPNPVTDKINFVQQDDWNNSRVSIIDLTGKVVKSFMLTSSITVADLASLPQGIYIYSVVTGDGKVAKNGKIIKE